MSLHLLNAYLDSNFGWYNPNLALFSNLFGFSFDFKQWNLMVTFFCCDLFLIGTLNYLFEYLYCWSLSCSLILWYSFLANFKVLYLIFISNLASTEKIKYLKLILETYYFKYPVENGQDHFWIQESPILLALIPLAVKIFQINVFSHVH